MSKQLTSIRTCNRKHTYASQAIAGRARKRRNKAAGIKYLSTYQCNVCTLWHVTTQVQNTPQQPQTKQEEKL